MNAPGKWITLFFLTLLLVLGGQLPGRSQAIIPLFNQATYTYSDDIAVVQGLGVVAQDPASASPLTDPLGQITGCDGEILSDYQGFSVGLYQPDPRDPTGGEILGLEPLTPTEIPDLQNNGIPAGIAPNIANSNPFFLTNNDQGRYNFQFDGTRGQLTLGKTYILVVNPPANSIYSQRRIRLTIIGRTANLLTYTATAVDGQLLSTTEDTSTLTGSVRIRDAERIGLNLSVVSLTITVCPLREIQIIKTGDRAAAEPGDPVIYRLLVRNLSRTTAISNLTVTDVLPLGFSFIDNSVRGELQGQPVAVTATRSGSNVILTSSITLPPQQTLTLAYAVILTPDALRGSGENAASVRGEITRARRSQTIADGPSRYRLRIRPGILSDCGTIIGRVFVDKNFDGEQQPNEPGVPNAVLYLDDGNRITTDASGLFSVANVLAGYRTATLDLSSLPGYTLAPNLYFIERNSQSRLVHLEPGGLVRMNFAVTPIYQQGPS